MAIASTSLSAIPAGNFKGALEARWAQLSPADTSKPSTWFSLSYKLGWSTVLRHWPPFH